MDGTNGIDGATGEQGISGQDGNANVVASDWIEPTSGSDYSVNNSRHKALPLLSNIDLDIIQQGVILVYYDNDSQVNLLDYIIENPSTGALFKTIKSYINHASRTLYLSISKYGADLTTSEYLWNPSGSAYARGVRFRYVIIPANNKNSLDYSKMTYHEVMDHLGLDY